MDTVDLLVEASAKYYEVVVLTVPKNETGGINSSDLVKALNKHFEERFGEEPLQMEISSWKRVGS